MATILIVDDEPRNLKLLEAHLVPEGYDVVKAENGEKALDCLKTEHIDLILLDVMMPGMNGFEVLQRIREDEKNKLLPVVLVTALAKTEDRVKGIEAGCDDFITKPIDSSEVLARVKTLLKLSYYRNQLDEREKWDYIFHNAVDGIIALNQKLEIERVNIRAQQLFGFEKDGCDDVLSLLVQKFKIHGNVDVRKNIQKENQSFMIERPETQSVGALYLAVRSHIIQDTLGNTASIILLFHDVTEEYKKDIITRDFLGLISHKLRTPLTVILPSLSMILEGVMGDLNEKQSSLLNKVQARAYDIHGNIEALLSFATILNGELDLAPEDVKLNELLPDIFDLLKKRYAGKKININTKVEKNLLIKMNRVYSDLLIQALVGNAIKFCDKDEVNVDFVAKKNNGNTQIMIRDNGSGIPSEFLDKVFDKFFQIEKDYTGSIPGLGLGLHLAKHIVENHGGSIELQSQQDKGTEVMINLL